MRGGPRKLTTAILLGLLQGVTEWLPISSEGIVAATYSTLEDEPFEKAVMYALWLHVGTLPAALVVFRAEVAHIIVEVRRNPFMPSPLLLFLVISTLLSGILGLLLLLILGQVSGLVGTSAMGIIGIFMLVNGGVQLRRNPPENRERSTLSIPDSIFSGIAQGFSVIPGLSRSGLTIATLLGRGIDKREALVLSFLMSIPASMGASLYSALNSDLVISRELIVAAAVAFATGIVTIQILLKIAQRVNFGIFVMIVGLTIISASIWEFVRV